MASEQQFKKLSENLEAAEAQVKAKRSEREGLLGFVDDLKSPSAAAYFDCSNMLKYMVPSATWIRKLGKRMVKFDFKGYSHTKSWCPIGEGDEDWPEVLKALGEIGYDGWATAEVGGGGEKVLRDISQRMDKILGLA